jgi:tetratricopeptide (TPR) repeat protein
LLVALGLLGAGIALRPLEAPAWEEVRAKQPALRLESLKDALGQGVTVGLLGGFRAIVADLFWIRTNSIWEKNDLPGTQTSIKLVTAIDPRPLYFWLNGSRMIAYDMPNWRIDANGGWEAVSDIRKRRFDEEQSDIAIKYLEGGLGFHPNEPLLILEIGNIHLNRLKDVETAARYYLEASKQPGAPYYAARIYGELLRRLERLPEAYEFLKKLYPTLPKDDDMAQAPIVLERIRELESELNIPPALRFRE